MTATTRTATLDSIWRPVPADPVSVLAVLANRLKEAAQSHEAAAPHDSGASPDIDLAARGDGEAFRRLVEKHQQQVAGQMWRFTRDPEVHRELVQNVFVEVYKSLGGYRGRAPFEHWIARIATRAGYRFWKEEARRRRRPAVPLEEWDGVVPGEAGELPPEEAADLVHGLLARLPERDRLVLTLRYLEDRSVEETADLTGWSRTMVKVQALRARGKLRKLLERAMGNEND